MEVIQIAILFSRVKVQSADQSETVQISGIHKEYDDIMGKPWRPHYRISISLVILTKRTAWGQVKCSRHRVARRRLVRRNHCNLGRFLDLTTRWGDDSIDFNFLLCLSKSIPRGIWGEKRKIVQYMNNSQKIIAIYKLICYYYTVRLGGFFTQKEETI
jgi:hypothetical protein